MADGRACKAGPARVAALSSEEELEVWTCRIRAVLIVRCCVGYIWLLCPHKTLWSISWHVARARRVQAFPGVGSVPRPGRGGTQFARTLTAPGRKPRGLKRSGYVLRQQAEERPHLP